MPLIHSPVLVRLGVNVDWEHEKVCFESFLRELAYFYAPSRLAYLGEQANSASNKHKSGLSEIELEEKRQLEHVVFPAARQYLVPPDSLLERDVVQVTTLEKLFKV